MAKAKYTYNEKRKAWITQVWDGTYTPEGFKHRKTLYSKKSSKDLERIVAEFNAQVAQKGITFHNDITFGEYALHWLDTAKATREKNTIAMYRNIIMVHLAPVADVPVAKIQHSHFLQVINYAADKPRTCEQIYITFKQIIKMAVQDRILTNSDFEIITANISLPKKIKREKRALRASEKDAIKIADFTDKEKCFVAILYSCGLRREEILALTPFDFDFAKKEISINKVVIFDGNSPEIKNCTKSDRGMRKVPFPQMHDFEKYIRSSNGYLFGNDGRLITKSGYDSMWKRILLKINEAAGGKNQYNPQKGKTEIVINKVDGLTAHIFRHNYCTELCYQVPKISIKKIAQLMGDTEKMVMDVYNHIVDEKEEVTDVISNSFAM